jgi:phosphoglycerate dehydrogenase-like enzyme
MARVELIQGWEFKFLTSYEKNDIISACRGADFLLTPPNYPSLNAEVLAEIPSISLIQTTGSGFDRVDLEAARKLNLPVDNVPGQNAQTVAEFTIGLIIALQRRIVPSDREIKAGNYHGIRERLLAGGLSEIRDTELGIVGLGQIGRQVARLAVMLGARVSYFPRDQAAWAAEMQLGVSYKPWEQLLATSGVVSLHVPLNDQTRGLIGIRELSLMPPGSFIINTARGEVIDQTALAAKLEDGHLAGAAMDTLAPEPPPSGHPLLCLSPAARDRLIVTPHLAGATSRGFARLLRTALDNLQRVARGGEPRNVVNGVGRQGN